jgi:hypothetical protein
LDAFLFIIIKCLHVGSCILFFTVVYIVCLKYVHNLYVVKYYSTVDLLY